MNRCRQGADRIFHALLVLEITIVSFYFLGLALGWPGDVPGLAELDGENSLPSWVTFFQLLLIGTLFILSARFTPQADEEPSDIFLLFSGFFFLLLCFRQTNLPSLRGVDLFGALPVALLVAGLIWRAGRHSFATMRLRFHRESVIMLAGLWLYLFGSVGVEILQAHFLPGGTVLAAPGKAFFEMSGGTVILYGLLLFRRERDRCISRLAIA